MAHENTVIQSINLPGEAVCVDIFKRTDGSFGYDEFRRDPEDGRGWFSIRHADGLTFDTAQAALDAAIQAVEWLADEV